VGLTASGEGHPLDRAARTLFAGHLALILFSTAAMVTILAGGFPAWMQGPYTPRVFDLGWTWSGQAYIVLGTLAALAHSTARFGARRAMLLASAAVSVALLSELGGTNIGVPFGPYHYTEMLGFRINGDVPYPIPLSWYYMLYGSLAICSRLLATDDSSASRWRWALLAAALLTAWDVPMEAQMTYVVPTHWAWDLQRIPAWVPAWLGAPLYYGMPLTNWIGWFGTGLLVSRLLLQIVPPSAWARSVAPAVLPLALYAANGIMPVAVTARHGLWLAAAGGFVAMGTPLFLVWRARRRSDPRYEPARSAA